MPWGRCYWCWAWVPDPYLIDGLGGEAFGCLCEACEELWLDEERPPWQPDGVGRCALWLRLFFDDARAPPASQPLPAVIHYGIARCLIAWDAA